MKMICMVAESADVWIEKVEERWEAHIYWGVTRPHEVERRMTREEVIAFVDSRVNRLSDFKVVP